MFSEATRLWSILEAIAARIEDCKDSIELEEAFWHLIKNWEHISRNVLKLCDGLSKMGDEAPPYFR
jgi:predicted DNA-binding ribbon-helix-helix protein